MMWGTTSLCAKPTGDSGSGFEAISIGDCRQHARPGSSRFLLHLEPAYLASTPDMIAATPSAKKAKISGG